MEYDQENLDKIKNLIKQLSEFNVGAAIFLTDCFLSNNDSELLNILFMKLANCKTIRGSNIYVLWNDLADRNYKKLYNILLKCPDDILEEACNKQDRYSGKTLINKYL